MAEGPAKQNIEYYNNDLDSRTFVFTDEDDVAIDLSADTLIWTAKKRKGGAVAASLSSTIQVSGAGNNEVTIPFNFDLKEFNYYHDLYNVTQDYTLMFGIFKVTEEVHE